MTWWEWLLVVWPVASFLLGLALARIASMPLQHRRPARVRRQG